MNIVFQAIMRGDYSGSTAVQFLNTTDSLPHALDFSPKRGALFWGVHGQGIKMTTLEDRVTIDVVVNQTDFGLIADLKVRTMGLQMAFFDTMLLNKIVFVLWYINNHISRKKKEKKTLQS